MLNSRKKIINKKNMSIFIMVLAFGLIFLGILLIINPIFKKKSVLDKAYKKAIISENMNGYALYQFLSGVDLEDKYKKMVIIENYRNEKYRITIENEVLDSEESSNTVIYVFDGIPYIEDDNNQNQKFNKKVIYDNTEIYLKGLIEAKEITYFGKEKLENTEYERYDFVIDSETMKEIMKYTKMPDFKIDNKKIECSVLLDNNGYIYKIIYHLNNDLKDKQAIKLNIFVLSYNQVEDFQ